MCNKHFSEVVDHIWEIRWMYGDEYNLNESNCMASCHACHNTKTNKVRKTLNNEKVTKQTFLVLKQYVKTMEQLELIKEIEKRTKDN
ncbi:HNH endonuclease [Aeromonas caviae]|uniref:HNH endonuclease n=1 Tax=Aeromonas caviae TaxID=648 RepID=UPI003873B314